MDVELSAAGGDTYGGDTVAVAVQDALDEIKALPAVSDVEVPAGAPELYEDSMIAQTTDRRSFEGDIARLLLRNEASMVLSARAGR